MPRGIYERTPAIRSAIRCARLGTHATPETKRKLSALARARAHSPKWRMRVSEGTRKAMRSPSVRRKHLRGLRRAQIKYGVNFTNDKTEKRLAKMLVPLGYVEQYCLRRGPGSGNRYVLDFALVNEKINVECDGPKHRPFAIQKRDKRRDSFLRSLGWKVIRVSHD